MSGQGGLWWYEVDVLPVTGFVRAPDREAAEAAALDVAANAIRDYLASGTWKLQEVLTHEEVDHAPSAPNRD